MVKNACCFTYLKIHYFFCNGHGRKNIFSKTSASTFRFPLVPSQPHSKIKIKDRKNREKELRRIRLLSYSYLWHQRELPTLNSLDIFLFLVLIFSCCWLSNTVVKGESNVSHHTTESLIEVCMQRRKTLTSLHRNITAIWKKLKNYLWAENFI